MLEVQKKENESVPNLLRRFTRKVQQSGLLARKRSLQFKQRPKSDFKKKRDALRRIQTRRRIEKLRKLGKIK